MNINLVMCLIFLSYCHIETNMKFKHVGLSVIYLCSYLTLKNISLSHFHFILLFPFKHIWFWYIDALCNYFAFFLDQSSDYISRIPNIKFWITERRFNKSEKPLFYCLIRKTTWLNKVQNVLERLDLIMEKNKCMS